MAVKKDKYVVFHISGGLGKHIAATALITSIVKTYPDRKLIIVSGYSEIFLYDTRVYRCYALGQTPYFYDNYIDGKDTIILKGEPYDRTSHIMKKSHLIESWHNLLDLKYDNVFPELHTNFRFNRLVWEKYKRDKPILLIHTNGGPFDQQLQYSWSRDMPKKLAEDLIKEYSNRYHIIQICRHESQSIEGVESIVQKTWNFEILLLLRVTEKRILVDSCLQHAAAALKLPSTVLWIGTSPVTFGYEVHNNIVSTKTKIKNEKNPHAYLFDYELWGDPVQCPYEDDGLFKLNDIINTL